MANFSFPIFHCFYFNSHFNLPFSLFVRNLFSFSLMVETSALCFLPIDFSLQRTLLVYLLIHFLSQILDFPFICPSHPLRFAVKASSISHFSSSPLQMELKSQILNMFVRLWGVVCSDWKPDLVGVIWSSTLYQLSN